MPCATKWSDLTLDSSCSHAPERKRSSDTRMIQHAMSGLLDKTASKAAGREANLKEVPEDIDSEPDLDESHQEVSRRRQHAGHGHLYDGASAHIFFDRLQQSSAAGTSSQERK